jgi:hypothetical protein
VWRPWLAWAGLLGLALLQAWAYYFKFPLSLGPRVILQPWLLQRGFVLYEMIADLHSPLMPLTLAALRPLFPDGLQLAKLALVALISCTTLLTFLVGRRRIGWLGGLWAACFFVVWSPTFGFGKLWHETFLAPLYLLLMLLYDPAASRRSVASLLSLGFACGVAVLVKQHAAVVFGALVLWNAVAGWRRRRSVRDILLEAGLLSMAAALPVLAFVIYQYMRAGTLEGLWYWTIGYNLTSEYKSQAASGPTGAQIGAIASSCLLVPAAIWSWIDSKRKGDETWQHLGWAFVLVATSSATAYPRFGMFHLQAALPALAVLSSLTLAYSLRPQQPGRSYAASIALALSAFWLVTAGSVYPPAFRAGQQRQISEYSDLVPLAKGIRQQIGPSECIYILPDDEATANLYYLTQCPPPPFWIFHYPWYMLDRIQHRIVTALQDQPPEWVVYFPGRQDMERNTPEIVDYVEGRYRQEVELEWAQGKVRLLKRAP